MLPICNLIKKEIVILRDHERETFELARGEGVGERESCPGGPRSGVLGGGIGVEGVWTMGVASFTSKEVRADALRGFRSVLERLGLFPSVLGYFRPFWEDSENRMTTSHPTTQM